jgi:hypothetical protein
VFAPPAGKKKQAELQPPAAVTHPPSPFAVGPAQLLPCGHRQPGNTSGSGTPAAATEQRPPWDFANISIFPPGREQPLPASSLNQPARLPIQGIRMEGHADDSLGHEGESMSGPPALGTSVSSAPPDVDGKLEENRLPKKSLGPEAALGNVPVIVHEVLRSPGQPLDPATRTFMESRFAHNFADVRVHSDAAAAESAESVNASAYTVGTHIVVGRSQPTTGAVAGRPLLAHELAHVIQQSRGGPEPQLNPYALHERDAQVAAHDVVRGLSRVGVACHTGVGLARNRKQQTPFIPSNLDHLIEVTRDFYQEQFGEPPATLGDLEAGLRHIAASGGEEKAAFAQLHLQQIDELMDIRETIRHVEDTRINANTLIAEVLPEGRGRKGTRRIGALLDRLSRVAKVGNARQAIRAEQLSQQLGRLENRLRAFGELPQTPPAEVGVPSLAPHSPPARTQSGEINEPIRPPLSVTGPAARTQSGESSGRKEPPPTAAEPPARTVIVENSTQKEPLAAVKPAAQTVTGEINTPESEPGATPPRATGRLSGVFSSAATGVLVSGLLLFEAWLKGRLRSRIIDGDITRLGPLIFTQLWAHTGQAASIQARGKTAYANITLSVGEGANVISDTAPSVRLSHVEFSEDEINTTGVTDTTTHFGSIHYQTPYTYSFPFPVSEGAAALVRQYRSAKDETTKSRLKQQIIQLFGPAADTDVLNASMWPQFDYVSGSSAIHHGVNARGFTTSQPPVVIRKLPIHEKLRLVGLLFAGTVVDDDIYAIGTIYRYSTPDEKAQIRASIDINDLTESYQRKMMELVFRS